MNYTNDCSVYAYKFQKKQLYIKLLIKLAPSTKG